MDAEKAFPILRVLDEEGQLIGDRSGVSDDQIRDFYQRLVTLRALDQRAWNLQRQGRIGTYPPYSGQEATQLGVVAALQKDDWICGSYRDWAALVSAGTPMSYPLLNSMGHPASGHIPEGIHALPVQVVIAAQILHAVGLSWAAKLRGENRVAVTFFGDGATSQGDFHEALNLASVMKTPTVFLCQNNQWAISVPVSRQMNTPTIAQRALGYGIEGLRVDGNDVISVYQTLKTVVENVRQGSGPVLIEAVTYRLGAHTTADDPTRYRPDEEDKRLSHGEPILRLKKYLLQQGLVTEEQLSSIDNDAKAEVERAVQDAEAYPKASPESVFDFVYDQLTAPLQVQKESFSNWISEGGAHRG